MFNPSYERSLEPDPNIEVAYVHHTAFGNLAMASEGMAQTTSLGMAAMRAYRIVEHHVSQAVDLGGMSEDHAKHLLWQTVASDRAAFTERDLLRRLGYRNRTDDEGYVPLMDDTNKLFGTCFDDGYYTLSFSQHGETQMYADETPFTELNTQMAAGKGPNNLVVVHGTNTKNLPAEQLGDEYQPDLLAVPLQAIFPAGQAKLTSRLSRQVLHGKVVQVIEADVRSDYLRELTDDLSRQVEQAGEWQASDYEFCRQALTTMMSALAKVMAKPSFSDRRKNFLEPEELVRRAISHTWLNTSGIIGPARRRSPQQRGVGPILYSN